MQIGNGQTALHREFGDAKDMGDILDAAAFLQQSLEGFELVHFVHGKMGDILNQRGFHRLRVIAFGHDGTRDGLDGGALLFQFAGGKEAAPSGNNLIALAIRADQERLQDAAFLDARE